ncbi:PadR family transcriptional regulator [Virgisporangium aliadipatigenens]|uniref:PadR family transcriptional regulator n=1 Tax=Virgisporangium aliadipatigenens TaxID=741659 RepID=A0A8J4DPT6_9ACTN|nr:PadR family transcriptional regulator [Virgisporangium aliadipatigenens]GIJ44998.1 PadR family transcriptional regulator [Virgisporangium aliadipatigenens]
MTEHRRSPLAVVVLSLLAEEPMHAYRMQHLIKYRRKDSVANVSQRNSVYQTIDRLLRAGLVRVHETERAGTRPERTVYTITDEGVGTLDGWLRDMVSAPAREFPEFPAALASLARITPDRVAEWLDARAATLAERLKTAAADLENVPGLDRIFLLEEEWREAVTRAELRWVEGVRDDLHTGRLTWDLEDLQRRWAGH